VGEEDYADDNPENREANIRTRIMGWRFRTFRTAWPGDNLSA